MRNVLIAISLALGLSACANGQLTPTVHDRLQVASQWAHRGSTTAHALIIGISASCASNPSKFCTHAMPIVQLADGALAIFDKTLAAADAALEAGNADDATLGNALASLIATEKDMENFIAQIKATPAT